MTLPSDEHRCNFVTSKGNRCRLPLLGDAPNCAVHREDVPKCLAGVRQIANREMLDTAEGIHLVLANTLRALAKGRIPERRASVIGYLAQVMLASLDHLNEERRFILVKEEAEAIRDRMTCESMLDRALEAATHRNGKGDKSQSTPSQTSASEVASAPLAR